MVSRKYSHDLSNGIPILLDIEGYDGLISIGEVSCNPSYEEGLREALDILRNPEIATPEKLSEDLDLVLAQFDELELKSRNLLSKVKYN